MRETMIGSRNSQSGGLWVDTMKRPANSGRNAVSKILGAGRRGTSYTCLL